MNNISLGTGLLYFYSEKEFIEEQDLSDVDTLISLMKGKRSQKLREKLYFKWQNMMIFQIVFLK